MSRLDSDALLRRAQGGDTRALDRLFARYITRLRRWAHGRIPRWGRGAADTDDAVQDAALQVFKRVRRFQPQREGALFGYLRLTLLNRIRDRLRHASRYPVAVSFDGREVPGGDSPFTVASQHEDRERYLLGLKRLQPADRHAIVARLELGYTYEQIAFVLDKPSAEAARLAVRRALLRLGQEMKGA